MNAFHKTAIFKAKHKCVFRLCKKEKNLHKHQYEKLLLRYTFPYEVNVSVNKEVTLNHRGLTDILKGSIYQQSKNENSVDLDPNNKKQFFGETGYHLLKVLTTNPNHVCQGFWLE